MLLIVQIKLTDFVFKLLVDVYFIKEIFFFSFNGDPIIPKDVYKKVDAYNNQEECQNLEDLMKIKLDISSLHYESLIIR